MKILITGKDSFIGKNFIKYSGYTDITEISLIGNKPENIDFTTFDVVLHLAAIVHRKEKLPDSLYFQVNSKLPLAVAQKAKSDGVKHFIFLSTMSVYGEALSGKSVFTEDTVCAPENAYGKSKYEAENQLQKLADYNFTVSIIRPPLVYGDNVIANMLSIVKLVEKLPVLPFANTNNLRSFIAAENLVAYIDRIIEIKSDGIHLVSDDKPISTTNLVQFIADNLGKKRILFKLPFFLIKLGTKLKPTIFDRLFGSFIVDNSNTNQKLNFKHVITVEQAIKKMIISYLKKTI